jgi:hypothetical protein
MVGPAVGWVAHRCDTRKIRCVTTSRRATNQAIGRELLAFTDAKLRIESEDPFAAAFTSRLGLDLLVTHEYLDARALSVVAVSGWIAHPMVQTPQLDHWVATTSRSLLGASVCCFEAPGRGYVVEVRSHVLAEHFDRGSLERTVELVEMATAVALRELKSIDAAWARPVRT